MMRIRTLTTAALMALAVTGIGFEAADAGQLGIGGVHYGFDEGDNIFTVEKVVDGPVPPISEPFVVEVSCASTGQGPDLGPFTVQFGADGVPADNSVYSIGANYTCTAVETVANNAVIGYACVSTQPAQCSDDQTAVFGDFTGAEATFTVTNTYEPAPADPAPAGAVAARPAFTG